MITKPTPRPREGGQEEYKYLTTKSRVKSIETAGGFDGHKAISKIVVRIKTNSPHGDPYRYEPVTREEATLLAQHLQRLRAGRPS